MLPTAVQSYCKHTHVTLTAIRSTVLEHLWNSRQPTKAYDVIDVLRRTGTGSAKPATVYRSLDYLAAAGLVHKVHSLNAYIPCHHPGSHTNCQLLICDSCHGAQEFCDAALQERIPASARAHGFTPTASIVEVHGICGNCNNT